MVKHELSLKLKYLINFFVKTDNQILKSIWKCQWPKLAKITLKKRKERSYIDSLLRSHELRKASSVINAKKWRKTIEWERLEISSRKLETPREHFMQR